MDTWAIRFLRSKIKKSLMKVMRAWTCEKVSRPQGGESSGSNSDWQLLFDEAHMGIVVQEMDEVSGQVLWRRSWTRRQSCPNAVREPGRYRTVNRQNKCVEEHRDNGRSTKQIRQP